MRRRTPRAWFSARRMSSSRTVSNWSRELVLELGVDRHQEVLALMLHAVAGIEHERRLGVGGGAGEARQRRLHGALFEVEALDDLEARLLQHRRHVGRVVARVRERWSAPIGGIADDERDAFFGRCLRKRERGQKRQPEQEDKLQLTHEVLRAGPHADNDASYHVRRCR